MKNFVLNLTTRFVFKTLQRLLKSRKPEDLEQANALIKSFVKKV